MKWKLLATVCLALIIIIIGITGCETLSPPSTQKAEPAGAGVLFSQQNTGIWVTGEGTVTVVPDIAILSLGVEAQSTAVAEAQGQATAAMAAMVAVLDSYEIAEKDVKTQHFSIIPVRRWSQEKEQEILIGYRVTNTITVKVREIDNTGAIIDAVARAGGDNTRINSISFTVDDPSTYQDEARGKAMANAEAKAKQLADLGNVRLGAPIYINESGGYTPVVREYFAEGAILAPLPAAAPPPISPGETEIRLSVQVVYGIE